VTLGTQEQVDTFANLGCPVIEGILYIGGDEITNLNGLASLTSVGTLQIFEADNLTSLNGLQNLSSAGEVDISNNPALSDISALAGLNRIDAENLVVRDCNALTLLEGLHNIK
jgi:hypothetical protein